MTDKLINTKLLSSEKNTSVIEVSVPVEIVATHRQHSLTHLAEGVTIKGFRKGKAPLSLIEKNLDPQKITDHTLNHVLGEVVSACLKNHQLDPIGYPKVKINSVVTDKPWTFEIRFPIRPQIKLGEYKKLIKDTLTDTGLWTPGKDKTKPTEPSIDEKLSKVLDLLAKHYQFDVPQELIEEEVNHSLSRLLEQTQTLGISLEEYLKSLGKTGDQLKDGYQKSATEGLKLELILEEIAKDLNTSVTSTEIDDMANASGKLEAHTLTDSQKNEIRAILRRRKTIDALLSL